MGLIYNIIIAFIHLLFVAFDVLTLMVLIKVAYERWDLQWLEKVSDATAPVMASMLGYVHKITHRITGKTYSDRTLIMLILIILMVSRLVIASVLIR